MHVTSGHALTLPREITELQHQDPTTLLEATCMHEYETKSPAAGSERSHKASLLSVPPSLLIFFILKARPGTARSRPCPCSTPGHNTWPSPKLALPLLASGPCPCPSSSRTCPPHTLGLAVPGPAGLLLLRLLRLLLGWLMVLAQLQLAAAPPCLPLPLPLPPLLPLRLDLLQRWPLPGC